MTLDLVRSKKTADEALVLARSMVVRTQAQLTSASAALNRVAELVKAVDSARTAETRPHLDAKAAVDAKYQPTLKVLKECQKVIHEKLAAPLQEQHRREHEARLALQASVAEAGGTARVDESTLVVAHGREDGRLELPETLRQTSTLTFRVVDEALVPREYLSVDEGKVDAEIERTHGACKIPGIEVVRTLGLARKGVVQK